MDFDDFIQGKVFYTKEGQWVVLNKTEETPNIQATIEACKSNEYFHVVKGNLHYVNVVVFCQEDFGNCRLCNTFL